MSVLLLLFRQVKPALWKAPPRPAFSLSFSSLPPHDPPTADLGARVSRGLGAEIVLSCMDDDHLADDLAHGKAVCEYRHISKAVVAQQRRQISRMIRVGTVQWVVMCACVAELIRRVARTAFAIVYMEREYAALTGLALRKIVNLDCDQDALIGLCKGGRPV